MGSPKVFADVLAVDAMRSYAAMYPTSERLMANAKEVTLANSTTEYEISLHDGLGSGVTLTVGSDLTVIVSPKQGLPGGDVRSLQTEQFRWCSGHGKNDGYLEHRPVEANLNNVYVPYANPSLAGGDDLEGGAKLLIDQGISAHGVGRVGRPPVLMAADAEVSHEGVRAVTGDGVLGKLKNGYSQDGPITYNGFFVVEQSGPRGESTFYNKHVLLRNATGRPDFNRAVESGKPVEISIMGNAAVARLLDSRVTDLHVFSNGKKKRFRQASYRQARSSTMVRSWVKRPKRTATNR